MIIPRGLFLSIDWLPRLPTLVVGLLKESPLLHVADLISTPNTSVGHWPWFWFKKETKESQITLQNVW